MATEVWSVATAAQQGHSVGAWRPSLHAASRAFLAWVVWDVGSAYLAFLLALRLTPYANSVSLWHPSGQSLLAATFAIPLAMSALALNCYPPASTARIRTIAKLALATVLGTSLHVAVVSNFVSAVQSPSLLGVLGAGVFIATVVPRLVVLTLLRTIPLRVALVGSPIEADQFADAVEEDSALCPRFTLAHYESMPEAASAGDIDCIVALGSTQSSTPERLLLPLIGNRLIYSESAFFERHCGRMRTTDPGFVWNLLNGSSAPSPLYRPLKRLTDVAISTVGILMTAPLFVLIAVAIKMTSAGPVLYSQTRVGLRGTPFRILKFRTMTANAEAAGAVWAQIGDARVTKVGRLLRKARLDELPQLVNVLRGEMSLVGPRPERPEFVSQLRAQLPTFDLRTQTLPGLTGWAQVNFRYCSTVEDARRKLEYDLFYLKNASFLFDAAILIRTIGAIMRGAR